MIINALVDLFSLVIGVKMFTKWKSILHWSLCFEHFIAVLQYQSWNQKCVFEKEETSYLDSLEKIVEHIDQLTPKIWILILLTSYYTFPCK